jgi:hypothetical protein
MFRLSPEAIGGVAAAEIDHIRATVEKNSRRMTLQLARDLGVPEVEVIRVLR